MNKECKFIFNGQSYYIGTIVKINEQYQGQVMFNSVLKFTGYNFYEDVYCFSSLQDCWEIYKLSDEQIKLYVSEILKECVTEQHNKSAHVAYVEGIVSAWIWYILIMFFALFLNGVENVIIIWCITTFVFFYWRHYKIKGG